MRRTGGLETPAQRWPARGKERSGKVMWRRKKRKRQGGLAEQLLAHKLWLEDPSEGQRADLSGMDLAGANLAGFDLWGAVMVGANLRFANLRGVDLRGADLRRADLRGADLREADLRAADLRRADLRGAVGGPYIDPTGSPTVEQVH